MGKAVGSPTSAPGEQVAGGAGAGGGGCGPHKEMALTLQCPNALEVLGSDRRSSGSCFSFLA